MASNARHPIETIDDAGLRRLMMRVDTNGFPGDLAHLWDVEHVRYRETSQRIPPARGDRDALLDLGSSRPWLPFLQVLLGYRRLVLNTVYPDSGFVEGGLRVKGAPPADVTVSVFDVERDRYPHEDASFDVVLCLEVLEHLAVDPMAMMAEVNRVLKPGGTFVLTTPNAVRHSNVVKMILGEYPLGWGSYNGFDRNRHNREYTPSEIDQLFRAAGFAPSEVTTFGSKRRGWRRDLMKAVVAAALVPFRNCPSRWRRDVILAVGTKTSPVRQRRPDWLYFDMAERVNATSIGNGVPKEEVLGDAGRPHSAISFQPSAR
ncbi:MAG: methyltransferase domain-containing protein [Planctomycetes bacterium]|nr:methyltransferase domain-containing protein [Planctomycetota bacterium]